MAQTQPAAGGPATAPASATGRQEGARGPSQGIYYRPCPRPSPQQSAPGTWCCRHIPAAAAAVVGGGCHCVSLPRSERAKGDRHLLRGAPAGPPGPSAQAGDRAQPPVRRVRTRAQPPVRRPGTLLQRPSWQGGDARAGSPQYRGQGVQAQAPGGLRPWPYSHAREAGPGGRSGHLGIFTAGVGVTCMRSASNPGTGERRGAHRPAMQRKPRADPTCRGRWSLCRQLPHLHTHPFTCSCPVMNAPAVCRGLDWGPSVTGCSRAGAAAPGSSPWKLPCHVKWSCRTSSLCLRRWHPRRAQV